MLIYLLRHGATACNAERRYQGNTEIPLSPAGRAALQKADFSPDSLFVSPLSRAVETAAILFPGIRQTSVSALREMDFGVFEGRNFREMECDGAYRAWVDGGCAGRCPGGESRDEFSSRVCGAFAAVVDGGLASGAVRLAIVAHGGTQMAAMERFALPRRTYFDWKAPCGGGFVLDTSPWQNGRLLNLVGEVRYAKE